MEQPGCSEGPGGQGLAPKGGGGWGGGSQARWPLPTQPPFLHLVFPLDQTRNKENVWNLSCLLSLLPAGQGPSVHGQPSPPALIPVWGLGKGQCWAGALPTPILMAQTGSDVQDT